MNSIRLEKSEDIIKFLRILAEESIDSARGDILNDPEQDRIASYMKSDTKLYGSIDEQEDEEEQPQNTEKPDNSENEKSPGLEVSLDSLTDAVKQLRSGRSVDDSRIKDQLRSYFDRLEPAEREALLAFMRAFGGILTGQLQGADAPDPSDPPYGINMSKPGEEAPEEAAEEEAVDEIPDDVEDDEEDEDENEEDTSPPIKAGSAQELSEIRRRVQLLMNR